MAKKCVEKCKSGKPCTFPALKDSQRCFVHDTRPEVAERRTKARQRGGAMRRQYVPHSPLKGRTVADIRDAAAEVVEDLRAGRIDLKAARALSYSCEIALLAREKSDKKERKKIESQLAPDEFVLHQLCELAGPGHSGSVRLRAIHRLAVICELI